MKAVDYIVLDVEMAFGQGSCMSHWRLASNSKQERTVHGKNLIFRSRLRGHILNVIYSSVLRYFDILFLVGGTSHCMRYMMKTFLE